MPSKAGSSTSCRKREPARAEGERSDVDRYVRRLFINRPEKHKSQYHKLTKSIHRYNTDKDSPAMEVQVTSWRDEERETQKAGEP